MRSPTRHRPRPTPRRLMSAPLGWTDGSDIGQGSERCQGLFSPRCTHRATPLPEGEVETARKRRPGEGLRRCRRSLPAASVPRPVPLTPAPLPPGEGFPLEAAQPPLPPLGRERALASAALPGRGALHHPVKARAAAGVAAAAVAGDADLEEDGVLVAVDAGLDH